ncbi:MAG: alpha/beta hydrolase [Bacteroidetes bacterium]|nr:MAG: alpha/beta hydrolase [Bacteroidota bacterium]
MAVLFFLLLLGLYWLAYRVPGNPWNEMARLPFWWLELMRQPIGPHRRGRHAYGPHRRQYFLLMEREAGLGPHDPLVLYIHGGGWQFGYPEAFLSQGQMLLEQGFTVVLPTHRRLPFHDGLAIQSDLVHCLQTLKKVLRERGWRSGPLILGGMSSGGHLAALLFFDAALWQAGGWPQPPAGLFLLGAPLELRAMRRSPWLRWLAGPPEGERFRKLNPIEHLQTRPYPPVLIVHGHLDGLVECENARIFARKLEACSPGCASCLWLERATHLDVAAWSFRDNAARHALLSFLRRWVPSPVG